MLGDIVGETLDCVLGNLLPLFAYVYEACPELYVFELWSYDDIVTGVI